MGFKRIQKLPTVEEILREIPIPEDIKKIKKGRDQEIINIFLRKSDKFLVIIGPCSAHDEKAVYEYVTKLAKLQEEVKDKIVLVPRIYTNKPRTTGKGYKGMAHQPKLTELPNMVEGLKAIRKMHIRVVKESNLTAADEMLYPENYPYLDDILSYVAIGARSVENQKHRLTVSGMDIPVGMKNPTSGDIEVMFNSVQAAQIPHDFVYNGWEVQTTGNPLAHCILRGAFNQYGQSIPNYHYEDLIQVAEMYGKRSFLKNPTLLVDTNHANSNKKYKEQPRIAIEVMDSREDSSIIKDLVKGLMIESYLVEGAQEESGKVYGKSITDPCIGWKDSETLVRKIAEYI